MLVKLTVGEKQELERLANKGEPRNGFQTLLLHLWYHLDDDTGEINLSYLLMSRIYKYAFQYGNAHWRRTLRRLFRRTLGANLNRGLVLQ